MRNKIFAICAVFSLLFLVTAPVLAQNDGQFPLSDDAGQEQQNQSDDEVGADEDEETSSEGVLGGICTTDAGLGVCINQLYVLSLGIAALLAVFMIVIAGYQYMTAQGNAQQVESAKEGFAGAFIGLIVIFVAFILLRQINPDLTEFKDFTQLKQQLELPEIASNSVTFSADPRRIEAGETTVISWSTDTENAILCSVDYRGPTSGHLGSGSINGSFDFTPTESGQYFFDVVCDIEDSSNIRNTLILNVD